MAKQVTQFELLVSCPSDVKEELGIIKSAVDDFNRMFGQVNNANIVIKHWSTDSFPQSGGAPQALLNKQFVLDCDAAVAVFWTRFGTPTDEYGSGTEEEIEELIKSGKQVFLYFSDCPARPSSTDHEQYQKVLSFREKYKDRGIFCIYSSLDEFKKSILNHISLYFVKLLTNEDTDIVQNKSKLTIRGVKNGKLVEQPVIFRRNYVNSSFINNMKYSISNKIEQVQKQVLPPKVVVEPKTPKYDDQLLKFAGLVSNSLPFSKAIISDAMKKPIIDFAQENNIYIQYDEFFYIGDLVKQKNILGGGPLGMGPSYTVEGTEVEKNKYNLIRELFAEINGYHQYLKYFSILENKYYLELVLLNSGTSYDEDIDVKLFISKGLLCTKKQLPFPGDDILQTINELIHGMFKSKKLVSVNEYSDYPFIPAIPSNLILTRNDEVNNEKEEYINNIDMVFCYDHFSDTEYDIICYNQKYIKQNTGTFLPSILVFNDVVDEIIYEITSKHCPQVIREQLPISNDFLNKSE